MVVGEVVLGVVVGAADATIVMDAVGDADEVVASIAPPAVVGPVVIGAADPSPHGAWGME